MDDIGLSNTSIKKVLEQIYFLACNMEGEEAMKMLQEVAIFRGAELAACPILADLIPAFYLREKSIALEDVLHHLANDHSAELVINPELGSVISALSRTNQLASALEIITTTSSKHKKEFLSVPKLKDALSAFERKASTTQQGVRIGAFLDELYDWSHGNAGSVNFPTSPRLENTALKSGISPDATGLGY